MLNVREFCGMVTIKTDFRMIPLKAEMLSWVDNLKDLAADVTYPDVSLVLLNSLERIPGVDHIYINQYEATVHIEGLFTPRTVLPLVEQILGQLEPELTASNN